VQISGLLIARQPTAISNIQRKHALTAQQTMKINEFRYKNRAIRFSEKNIVSPLSPSLKQKIKGDPETALSLKTLTTIARKLTRPYDPYESGPPGINFSPGACNRKPCQGGRGHEFPIRWNGNLALCKKKNKIIKTCIFGPSGQQQVTRAGNSGQESKQPLRNGLTSFKTGYIQSHHDVVCS